MDIYVKILSIAKCFRGFGIGELKQLLSIASKAAWRAGEDIFLEGDSGRDMFIICAGKVRIWRATGDERLDLAILTVGESFGEMGLLEAGKRSAGATAIEDGVALRINHDRLDQVPAAASLLFRNIARELAERLSSANDVIIFQSQSFGELPPLEGEEQSA